MFAFTHRTRLGRGARAGLVGAGLQGRCGSGATGGWPSHGSGLVSRSFLSRLQCSGQSSADCPAQGGCSAARKACFARAPPWCPRAVVPPRPSRPQRSAASAFFPPSLHDRLVKAGGAAGHPVPAGITRRGKAGESQEKSPQYLHFTFLSPSITVQSPLSTSPFVQQPLS